MSQPSITTVLPRTQLPSTAQKLHVLNSLSHFSPFDSTTDFLNALFSHPLGNGLTSLCRTLHRSRVEYGSDLLHARLLDMLSHNIGEIHYLDDICEIRSE
jgi:hypothetical protein